MSTARIKSIFAEEDLEKGNSIQGWEPNPKTKRVAGCAPEELRHKMVASQGDIVAYTLESAASQHSWVENFEKTVEQFARFAQTKRRQFQTIDSLMSNVKQLEKRIAELSAQPFQALITTLAPDPFDLKRDIPVVVTPNGEDFVATFFDAGISATGDTDEEAVFNLKDLIVQTFEALSKMPEAKLGFLPRKQLAVLRTLVVSKAGGQ